MPEIAEDCLYTKDHEWIRIEGNTALVGITDYAQESLGDVVYVELPKVDNTFDMADVFGTVESVKAVSELYMPMSGRVIEVNDQLNDAPDTINNDPYGNAWMIKIELSDPGESSELLSPSDYLEFVQEESQE